MPAARLLFLAACVPVAAAMQGTQQSRPVSAPDPATVIAAERAFARASIEHGMKSAFLSNLAPDAIVFRPGPVPAVAWFEAHPTPDGRLEWAPELAAIASSGDLGFTAGPWRWQEPAGEATWGHYLTVWRRESNGEWKVVVDGGVQHAAVELEVEPSIPAWSSARERADEAAHGHATPHTGDTDALLHADRAFTADLARLGWAAALENWASDDVRVYRPGALPAIGPTDAVAALRGRPGAVRSATPEGGGTSGDLGYTYGTFEFEPAGAAPGSVEAYAYLRVWRATQDERRVIVIDLASPMPPPR